MSKKSIKRYLMLLAAIGLVAFASGGAGTFASFNAEVTNTGNYFASGTLVLNDNGGTNTCTSAGATNNQNNLATNGCDTLFQVAKLATPTAALAAPALVSGTAVSVLNFGGAGLAGGAIDAGDTLTVTSGSHTATFQATASAAIGASLVAVTLHDPGDNLPVGSKITDSATTQYAKLQLTNAGTLDASGITVKMPSCTASAAEGSTTFTGFTLSGLDVSAINFSALGAGNSFNVGDPIVVKEGNNAQTFISTQAVGPADTSVTVQADQPPNAAYTGAATVSGPTFPVAGNLCTALKLSIVETDASYDIGSPAAEGCAYGTTDNTYDVGCTLDSGHTLASIPSSYHALSLAPDILSNSGTNLTAGQSRYFLVGVKLPTGGFADNTFQNLKAAFGLTWHIDQA